jgi:hypothetical protein
LGAALGLAEEGSALVGIVPKLMAQDAKSALGIAETASHIDGGLLFDEEGAESFILALQWKLWSKEETSVWGSRYLIDSAGRHKVMMLPKHSNVNMFIKARVRLALAVNIDGIQAPLRSRASARRAARM